MDTGDARTGQGPADPGCTLCGGSLSSEVPSECRLCGALACPYCRSAVLITNKHSVGGCDHLLAVSSDDPDFHGDFYAFEMPLPCIESQHDVELEDEERDWSDAQKVAAFGDLRPLLAAYEDWEGLWRPPWEYLLFVECVERLSVPVQDLYWGERRFHFVGEPEKARCEIAAMITRLTEGFERLAMTEPEGRR